MSRSSHSLPKSLKSFAATSSGRVPLLGLLLCGARAGAAGAARSTRRMRRAWPRLEEQIEAFRAAVGPKPSDRLRRAKLLSKLERISKQLLGLDVQVLGYGSCFTGVGESDAEIDATVYIPMTPARAAELKTVAATRSRQMRAIVNKCAQLGLQTSDNFGVRRGTACIEESASVHLSGNLWRTYSAARCILSCQRLMPLYSSHLVRVHLSFLQSPTDRIVCGWTLLAKAFCSSKVHICSLTPGSKA